LRGETILSLLTEEGTERIDSMASRHLVDTSKGL